MAKIAYLFGVSEYESWLDPLPEAVKDVDAMKLVLSDPKIGGFEVKVFRNPSAVQIRDELVNLFTNRSKDDLILLYFAGHGKVTEIGQFYFMAKDTEENKQTSFSKANAIPASYVHDLMVDCHSQRIVVILDCCHSGAFGKAMPRGLNKIDFEGQLGGEGRIILTASDETNYTFEDPGEEMATYTRYLVKGLKTGAADHDKDGWVSVNDLHAYVLEEAKTAKRKISPQRYMKGDGEKIKLAKAVIDPDFEYRKLVKKCCETGDILPSGRVILNRKRNHLATFGLTTERAANIEFEELEPYRKQRDEDRATYRKILQDTLALNSTQQVHAFEEIRELEKQLKLSIEDREEIRFEVLGSKKFPVLLPYPLMFVVKAIEKIKLAKAGIDADLEYRKLVKQYCKTGDILPVGRRILEQARDRLDSSGLTVKRAAAIELEELEPFRKLQKKNQDIYRKNQDVYRKKLRKIASLDRTSQFKAFAGIRDLGRRLKLSIEDIETIHLEVLGYKTLPENVSESPISPPPQPKAESRPPERPLKQSPAKMRRRRFLQYVLLSSGGWGMVSIGPRWVDEIKKGLTWGKTPLPVPPKGRAEILKLDLGNGVELKMVAIPAGSFMMGSPKNEKDRSDNEGQQQIKVPAFFMGQIQVTQAQWNAVAKLKKVKCDLALSDYSCNLPPDPSNFKGADHPVEQVSWHEAIEFCARLSEKTGKRYGLPSEAQWEYACRARTTTPFYFGETISTEVANYEGHHVYGDGKRGEYRKETTVTAKFPSNAFGLYDMHGNVWEWCADLWDDNYKNTPINVSTLPRLSYENLASGDNSYRPLRGGSWYSEPSYCRSATRSKSPVNSRDNTIGFRLILFSS
jgi:formylglycine-generating enzyme required for sulfatase activity